MPEVVVVGAGPAGSACALRLARAGVETTILERSAFPRTKVCGEYLNARAVALLGELGVADALRSAAGQIRAVRLFGAGTTLDVSLESEAWSLSRASLDAALLNAAVAAGAVLIRGRATSLESAGTSTRVRFSDSSGTADTVSARVVVGADGAESIVARASGLQGARLGAARFALGGHYRGLRGLNECVEMYVDRESYFAINPLSADTANVMVVVPERALNAWRDDVDARLRSVAERLSNGVRRLDASASLEKRVAVGPLVQRACAFASSNVLLVGDAGAFVDPFTGQGVALALEGAADAAEAIVSVLRGGTTQRSAWARYASRCTARVADRRRLALLVGGLVRVPSLARRAARNARTYPWAASRIANAVTGNAKAWSALLPAARLLA